jgi:hypothetical protein
MVMRHKHPMVKAYTSNGYAEGINIQGYAENTQRHSQRHKHPSAMVMPTTLSGMA